MHPHFQRCTRMFRDVLPFLVIHSSFQKCIPIFRNASLFPDMHPHFQRRTPPFSGTHLCFHTHTLRLQRCTPIFRDSSPFSEIQCTFRDTSLLLDIVPFSETDISHFRRYTPISRVASQAQTTAPIPGKISHLTLRSHPFSKQFLLPNGHNSLQNVCARLAGSHPAVPLTLDATWLCLHGGCARWWSCTVLVRCALCSLDVHCISCALYSMCIVSDVHCGGCTLWQCRCTALCRCTGLRKWCSSQLWPLTEASVGTGRFPSGSRELCTSPSVPLPSLQPLPQTEHCGPSLQQCAAPI